MWLKSHQLKEKIPLIPAFSFSFPLFQVFYLFLSKQNTKTLSIKGHSTLLKYIFYHLHHYLKTIAQPLLAEKIPSGGKKKGGIV